MYVAENFELIFSPVKSHLNPGSQNSRTLSPRVSKISERYDLESGKQLLAIKVSFRINKPGFPGVSDKIGDSFLSRKADLYDAISLKIEQLFN